MLDKGLILRIEAAYKDTSRMKPGDLKQWEREQRLLDDAFRERIQARGYLSRNDELNDDELRAIVDWKATRQKEMQGRIHLKWSNDTPRKRSVWQRPARLKRLFAV